MNHASDDGGDRNRDRDPRQGASSALTDATHARRVVAAAWWPPLAVEPLGDGHINATWLVTGRPPQAPAASRFVLQQISASVFPDPVAVMEKVVRVVSHLRSAAPGWTPALVATSTGDWFHKDADGGVWRLWRYVEGARTLQQLTTVEQAESAGRAFGSLHRWLRDLPGSLPDPIPGFMQLDHYLGRLDAIRGRAVVPDELRPMLDAIDQRRALAGAFGVRDRVVHGDCKVDNLLFHASRDEVVCILDLDTVMRGHWAWDAGDLIRSAAGDARGFSVPRFAGVTRGLRESGAIDAAPEMLVLAPRYVTLMLGVRFLTDHLEGDSYFRVGHRGENLQRARAQFALLAQMEALEAQMLEALTG
jgi:Ser/Thr protein kinase RdoA (MazF antagonist)